MNSNQDSNSEKEKFRKQNEELHEQNEELHRQNELLRLEKQERQSAKFQRQETINRFIQGIYYLGGALGILLTLRFLLLLFAANPNNLFASFILDLSQPFASPFANLFNNPQIGSNASFEITTIVGIVIYAILIRLVVHLIKLIWDS